MRAFQESSGVLTDAAEVVSCQSSYFENADVAAAWWPVTARAQQAGDIAHIGVLNTGLDDAVSGGLGYRAFVAELQKLGFAEGRNLIIEYRDAKGQIEQLPGLAAELVRAGVDVIVTTTELGTRAVKETGDRTAVLMVAINFDPLALCFIESIARPAGT